MIGFALIATLMTLAVLAMVIRPLLRRADAPPPDPSPAMAAFRQRILEMEEEQRAGLVSDAGMHEVRTELERDLLGAADTPREIPVTRSGSRGILVAVLVTLLMPALSIGAYLYLGRPDLAGPTTADATAPAVHPRDVERMVQQLADRLAQQPDDLQGWRMLARSYMVLGRYQQAADAMEHVHKLAGDQPDVLVGLADALGMINGGRLAGRPAELVQQALALDPSNRGALWMAGIAADQAGDQQQAGAYLEKLLLLFPPGSKEHEEVQGQLDRLRGASGAAVSPESSATTVSRSVHLHVQLAPQLADQLDPDATLFVFARAPGSPGMPLAVVRRSARELPADITLDDSMAMSDNLRLSRFGKVDVTARVSRSGEAAPATGDLSGHIQNADVGSGELYTLTIDTRIP